MKCLIWISFRSFQGRWRLVHPSGTQSCNWEATVKDFSEENQPNVFCGQCTSTSKPHQQNHSSLELHKWSIEHFLIFVFQEGLYECFNFESDGSLDPAPTLMGQGKIRFSTSYSENDGVLNVFISDAYNLPKEHFEDGTDYITIGTLYCRLFYIYLCRKLGVLHWGLSDFSSERYWREKEDQLSKGKQPKSKIRWKLRVQTPWWRRYVNVWNKNWRLRRFEIFYQVQLAHPRWTVGSWK